MKMTSPIQQDIIAAALELFVCNGFAGTCMADIAYKAGVSEDVVLLHYTTKEKLAATLFTEELQRVHEQLHAAGNLGDSIQQKLRGLIGSLYTTYKAEPYPLLFILLAFHNDAERYLLDEKASIYDVIFCSVRELVDSVDDTRDKDLLSSLLVGMILQPIFSHYWRKLRFPPPVFIEAVTEACCDLIGVSYDEKF